MTPERGPRDAAAPGTRSDHGANAGSKREEQPSGAHDKDLEYQKGCQRHPRWRQQDDGTAANADPSHDRPGCERATRQPAMNARRFTW